MSLNRPHPTCDARYMTLTCASDVWPTILNFDGHVPGAPPIWYVWYRVIAAVDEVAGSNQLQNLTIVVGRHEYDAFE